MQTQKKILLIDDDEDFVEINRTILSTQYDVEVAYNAHEGLEKINTAHFDLVIIDLMMEERDAGVSFTYTLKQNPNLKNIPIMLITSAPSVTGFDFNFERDREWLKVDDLVEKPVDSQDLLRRVEILLSEHGGTKS